MSGCPKRCHQNGVVLEQFLEFQGQVLRRRRRAEGQVDLARADQLDQRVVGAGEQADADVGKLVAEGLDTLGEMVGYEVRIGADHEGATPVGVVHLALEHLDGRHHGRDQFEQRDSLRGELDGALDAVKEGDTEFALEFAKVRGHRGLTQFQGSGRLGDASQACHVIKTYKFS